MAKKFKDTKGREWSLRLSFQNFEDILEELGDDLLSDPGNLSLHPRRWVEMLWVCIREEAKGRDVTPQEFGSSMDGNSLKQAMDAFMEDYSDFISPLLPDIAEAAKVAWETVQKGRAARATVIREEHGKMSTDFQDLLELTLAHTASGNYSKCSEDETQKS